MRTLAVQNAKGGTGKTTTAVHLAMGLARQKHEVLFVDLDGEQHGSRWLLGEERLGTVRQGIADALLAEKLTEEHVQAGPVEHLHVCAATSALTRAEKDLMEQMGPDGLLSRALKGLRFDYCVIDCPPNLGLCVRNALVAADGVLVPVAPANMSMRGVARITTALETARRRLGARAELVGYLLTAVDGRAALVESTRKFLEKEAPGALLRNMVRVSEAAKGLPDLGLTAFDAGADRRGAEDYPSVVAEVVKRLKQATGGKH